MDIIASVNDTIITQVEGTYNSQIITIQFEFSDQQNFNLSYMKIGNHVYSESEILDFIEKHFSY